MKTSKRILNILFVAALILGLLPVGSGFAEGTPLVTEGFDDAAEIMTWVRFRNFKNGTGIEARINAPNGLTEHSFSWKSPTPSTNPFIISYDIDTYLLELFVNGSKITSRLIDDLGPLNYIKIDLCNNASGAAVHLNNLTATSGDTITPSSNFSGTGLKTSNITGIDLSSSFTIEGVIYLTGKNQPQDDANYVEIGVGYLAPPPPPDEAGPEITGVVVNGVDVAYLNASATLMAAVDDTNMGGSNIASVSYSLNGGESIPMEATDGVLDSSYEEVTATFTAENLGENEVCVFATDTAGNESKECANFSVHYKFSGFFDPVAVGDTIMNEVKAGRTIPIKWRLADGLEVPITDSDPPSFEGIYSYQVACEDSTVLSLETEESSPGTSSLEYFEEENIWQYNWQTLKGYTKTCRVFYVKFTNGQESIGARFQFK